VPKRVVSLIWPQIKIPNGIVSGRAHAMVLCIWTHFKIISHTNILLYSYTDMMLLSHMLICSKTVIGANLQDLFCLRHPKSFEMMARNITLGLIRLMIMIKIANSLTFGLILIKMSWNNKATWSSIWLNRKEKSSITMMQEEFSLLE